MQLAMELLTQRLFPRTPNREDCRYCSFRVVCGEDAQARAEEVLRNAQGALAEFAKLKGADTHADNEGGHGPL
jgi:hypothetical protein